MLASRRKKALWPRLRRAAARSLGLAGLAVVVASGGMALWLAGTMPRTAGELRIAGLSQPASISRDQFGIVLIRAATAHDAQIALGYAHAQDRLWQMDVQRRLGAGRLAEIFGERALRSDRFMRTLGLARLADAQTASLDADVRDALAAYATGVNAAITGKGRRLPPEFGVLGYAPEPWTASDSLLWGRVMAMQLSTNMREELLWARLLLRLPPERVAALWADDDPAAGPQTLARADASLGTLPLARLAAALPDSVDAGGASNSWALAGQRTSSGAPLLANDPHLGLQTPGVWYLARIETPDGVLAGATAPGVPFLVLGHNGRVAWSMTTTHGDTMDLFIERVDPADPSRYLTPTGAQPFVTRSEQIRIKGGGVETLAIRETRHGPVVSDVAGVAQDVAGAGHVLALSAAGLAPDDRTPMALHHMNQATDAAAFLKALQDFNSPQQNITFADSSGRIGFAMPARIPIRRAGNGLQPVPGWDGSHDWVGFVPFADRPAAMDPPDGLLVNANNRIVGNDYPHPIAVHWPASYRARRVIDVLGETPGHDPGQSALLQSDTVSLAAREILPLLLERVAPGDVLAGLLAGWDGTARRNGPEALVFNAWQRELQRLLFIDDLGEAFGEFADPDPRLIARILRNDEPWCDDTMTPAVESCRDMVGKALVAARAALSEAYGNDPARWRWGDAHRANFRHGLLRFVPGLGNLVGVTIETDGDDFTVNRASPSSRGGNARFDHVHGAGLRAVYDLGNLDQSLFMITPGQSGHPLSRHFVDLAQVWRDGDHITLPPNLGGSPIASRLVLRP
ncbi:MAG: penicillin acylase family protein [Alphaproteobacteria bacterium]